MSSGTLADPLGAALAQADRIARERAEAHGFKRLNAPAFSAPAGLRIFQRESIVPARLARIRLWSDDEARVGERLLVEVFPHDEGADTLTLLVEVAWVHDAPASRARHEVGLVVKGIQGRDYATFEALLD